MASEYQCCGYFVTGHGDRQAGSAQLRQHDGQGHRHHLRTGRQRQQPGVQPVGLHGTDPGEHAERGPRHLPRRHDEGG